MRHEPAVILGAVTGLVTAIIAVLVVFGVNVSANQRDAVLALVVALAGLAPLVSGLLTRQRVFSPATVERLTAPEGQPGSHPRTVYDPDGDGVLDLGPTS